MSAGAEQDVVVNRTPLNELSDAIPWLADDLQELGTAADEFAEGRLAAAVRDNAHHAAPSFGGVLDDLHRLGFLHLCADARWGGLAQGSSALARVLEPVCAVDASAGAAIYAGAAAHLALRAGALSDAALQRPADFTGAWPAWPAFHNAAEQPWPTLSRSGQLNGDAGMLLLGTHARWAVLPARDANRALRMVLVDLQHPGVTRSAPVRTIGLAPCGIADVTFAEVPCTRISDDAHALMRQIEPTLAVAVIAMQCGVMRGSLQTAEAYAAERHQGGGNLLGWGEVRRLLSLMHERLNVARGMLGQAMHHANGESASSGLSAQFAALHVGQLACEHTTDGVQLLGGNGYMKDYGQAKRMRDARQVQGFLGGVAWRRQRLLDRLLVNSRV